MPKGMTKYQLEHFKEKVRRNFTPLIEEQELLVKQYTPEATNKASRKLAIKIGAQKIIDALKFAEEDLKIRGFGDVLGYQQSGIKEFIMGITARLARKKSNGR